MISSADAIVNPLAVMVVPLHTLVADVAVARVSSADDLAAGAQHIWVELLYESDEWDCRSASHISRLNLDRQGKEDLGSEEQKG